MSDPLDVRCPDCEQEPGARCIDLRTTGYGTSTYRKHPHPPRVRAAKAARAGLPPCPYCGHDTLIREDVGLCICTNPMCDSNHPKP